MNITRAIGFSLPRLHVCRRAMDNALHAVNDGGFTRLEPGAVPDSQERHGTLLWNPTQYGPGPKKTNELSVLPNGSSAGGVPWLAWRNSPVDDPSTDGKISRLSNNMTLKPARDNGT